MYEVWIKKTVYRRYLVSNETIEEVRIILNEGTQESVDLIEDAYDQNNLQQYDEESAIMPLDVDIQALGNEG